MMKYTKPNLRTLSAALTLGALSFGFAPAAMAISTYDALASFSLTLENVTDVNGNQVTTGWTVDALGDDFGGVFLDSFGDASATGEAMVVDPAVSMNISDSILQYSTASGTATAGYAYTSALTDLAIDVANTSGQGLSFSFSYNVTLEAFTEALVAGDSALADAGVDFLDDLGAVDILATVDAVDGSTDSFALNGIFAFDLADGGFNLITGTVDSSGEANAVPVPAAVWLFGSGLLGLVGVARRKQVA